MPLAEQCTISTPGNPARAAMLSSTPVFVKVVVI
jgi:hypothetical protein